MAAMSEPRVLHGHIVLPFVLGTPFPCHCGGDPACYYCGGSRKAAVGSAEFEVPAELDTLFTNAAGPGMFYFESIAHGDEEPVPFKDDLWMYGLRAERRPPLPCSRFAAPARSITAQVRFTGWCPPGHTCGSAWDLVLHFVGRPSAGR